ncbi:MAG: hypothetical protein ACFE7R_07230, partial [Candidatus Hodarchaeota archaeon]
MGSVDDWEMFSERVFRPSGRPGRLALTLMIVTLLAILLSVLTLSFFDRLELSLLNLDFLLSASAAILFFGVFGWGALFMKQAYYKTINNLTFKDEEGKAIFLDREMVFSNAHAAIGVIVTYSTFGLALSAWPLFTRFIPLTPEILPSFAILLALIALMGIVGVDACAAIPSLLTVPGKLKEHLQVGLLKPDRCGGAKAIGDFYSVFTVLV